MGQRITFAWDVSIVTIQLYPLLRRRWMTRSVIDASGLMNILSTNGPYLCRATMVLRKRDDDKLHSKFSKGSPSVAVQHLHLPLLI